MSVSSDFIAALRYVLNRQSDPPCDPPEIEDWTKVLEMAKKQNLLPLIADYILPGPAANTDNKGALAMWNNQIMMEFMLQVRRTEDFSNLIRTLQDAGLSPLVVKGIVLRQLYPNPDARPSSDEDLLIEPDRWAEYDAILKNLGYQITNTEDPETEFEISYGSPQHTLHIELHKQFFPPDSEAYGDLNRFFAHVRERAAYENGLLVPCPTDHFLYLVLHAYKHFLHGGFGVRQASDIALFAAHYGGDIDWKYIWKCCRSDRFDYFTAAVLKIGLEELSVALPLDRFPDGLKKAIREVDYKPMLSDLLDGGIYGDSTLSRKHSSTITLSAVAEDRKTAGRRRRKKNGRIGAAVSAVFLPYSAMKEKFPYLKKMPLLLPVAWLHRVFLFFRETRTSNVSSVKGSLRIGRERVELLRKYRILDRKK